jgi:signal peptidase I
VLLWVNGSVVRFDGPTTYFSPELVSPQWSPTDAGDLEPAGIGSRGADVKLTGLRVYRDKYYIATRSNDQQNDYDRYIDITGEAASALNASADEDERIQLIFARPDLWSQTNLFADGTRRHFDIRLQADQFLPLGDNSPQSYDGRYWENSSGSHRYVERELLIGKALLIYWPHTWNRPIPFQPNFSRMGRIR